jgi:hypothetical protein
LGCVWIATDDRLGVGRFNSGRILTKIRFAVK